MFAIASAFVLAFVPNESLTSDAAASGEPADARPAPSPTLQWIDYDGDGQVDAFALYPAGEGRLFRNMGDGTFADVTHAVGLPLDARSTTAAWADFDGDERVDVYLAGQGGGLYRNLGEKGFEDVTAASGLAGTRAELDAGWIDFDGDGAADLWIRTAGGDVLFRNGGHELFTPVALDPVFPVAAVTPVDPSHPQASAETMVGVDAVSADADRTPRDPEAPTPTQPPRSSHRAATPSPFAASAPNQPPGALGAPPSLQILCTRRMLDTAPAGTCSIEASTVPTLGKLYPLSTALNVDSNGSVGIGTTNIAPYSRLHVHGGQILASQPSGPGYRGFSLQTYLGVAKLSATSGDGETRGPLSLETSDASRVYIEAGGNVGIGTTSPAAPLQVSEGSDMQLHLRAMNGATGIAARNDANTSNAPLELQASEIRLMGGNVGIGTATPAAALDVYAPGADSAVFDSGSHTRVRITSQDTSFSPKLWLDRGGSDAWEMGIDNTFGSGGLYWYGGSPSNYRMGLAAGGDVILAPASGNVGIGTVTPATRLDVYSLGTIAARFAGAGHTKIRISSPSTAFNPAIQIDRGGSDLWEMGVDDALGAGGLYWYGGTTGNYRMGIAPGGDVLLAPVAGNVGIGTTTPGQRLTVAGVIRSTSGGIMFPDGSTQTTAASTPAQYWSPNGSHISNTNSGYVGIGVATPQHKLQVRGNVFVEMNPGVPMTAMGDASLPGVVNGPTSGGPGLVVSYAPDGDPIAALDHVVSGNQATNRAFVGVLRNHTYYAGMYVDASETSGTIFATTKNFREPNPNDPNTDIWYACIEGPEAAAYIRGTGHLVDGAAYIPLPDHFQAVSVSDGMTVQLTPCSPMSKGLAVTKQSTQGFAVNELFEGRGSYDFHWRVECVRKGQEGYRVIRAKDELQGSASAR